MRVFVVSNFYPPHQIGGYERLCQQVVERLEGRGHVIRILTSTYGVPGHVVERNVHRAVGLQGDIYFYRSGRIIESAIRGRRDRAYLRRELDSFHPDVVFIWGMWNLSKALAAEAEQRSIPVVYYLANPWPIEPNIHHAYWNSAARSWPRTLVKLAARVPAQLMLGGDWQPEQLRFEHAPCCSYALRNQLVDAGVPLTDAPVIYEGIELASYLAQPRPRPPERAAPLQLLFVGNLADHKGVHTAIEALARLPAPIRDGVELTVVGRGHPAYEQRLQQLVRDNALADRVRFVASVERSDLPALLGRSDALLLPSIWEEPLALIMQEGLASGLVVIGSTTGGTREIIEHGKNGLLFAAGNAAGLAGQVERLVGAPELCAQLGQAGRRSATELFDIDRMVRELDAYLRKVGGAASRQQLCGSYS